ncbi:MAG TPA: FAD-dependent oxidoreductase [SAR324 cluster bacterium]|nr:FAD-dependent oxidoreductase [SAR324 cluster bacterium]MEE1577536.1 FAD-dependent oxidoreductase [Deltaproteobacteria bacterium]MDP6464682.1 FAD-dependent oxidoreductase [SAR324 cluster bacterium]HJL85493.1 FAD-dependent oxidoreductase [SAR324 cluster bacterium]HJM05936.1 FAD-dependent oxidoreductase [SAR324 cluster bacterium]
MKNRIAVIGSGMAGLAAGWMCREGGAEVTILEALANRGMDSHTQFLNDEGGESGYVDLPLRVMSPHAWPTVLELCEKVGVQTFEVDTTVACSWLNAETWFRSSKLQFGSRMIPWAPLNYLLRPETYRMLLGFIRLSRSVPEVQDSGLTLKEFADQHRTDPLFWKGLLYPILTTICTCDEKTLDQWPAQQILDLLQTIVFGARLLRLQGGTKALAEKLGEGLNWQNGIRVDKLVEKSSGIFLHSKNAGFGPFDYVICAVQANQLDFLPEQYARESQLLNSFPYDSGTLWAHRDVRFMPERKQDWSPLHYQMDKEFRQSMFSVWVNPIEPTISHHQPVFQTWDPLFEPESEKVIAAVTMERAVINQDSQNLLRELDLLHKLPSRNVFFCGSYAAPGVPLLESAVRSAIKVVRHLGFDPSMKQMVEIHGSHGSIEGTSSHLAA